MFLACDDMNVIKIFTLKIISPGPENFSCSDL